MPSDKQAANAPVIELSKVSTRFGAHVVHTEIDLQVRRSEVFALIGGSGSGKSTLLREMILLQRPNSGSIRVLGVDLQDIGDDEALALRRRWGVMFQLVRKLRDLFGLTIVMITHDLDLLWQVADRVAVLGDGRVQGIGSMAELSQMPQPGIRMFFDGPRGRAAQQQEKHQAERNAGRKP